MKPSEIIKLARRQTGCTTDIVTEEEAYRFLNFVIEDFWADIRSSDSWYGFDTLTLDISAGQMTLDIDEAPWDWSQNFPISKLQKVWYLMPDWKWRDLPIHFVDKIDFNEFPNQWEPRICFIVRNTVNLVPDPKQDTQVMFWWFDYNWELQEDLWSITVGWLTYTRYKDKDVAWATYPYAWTNLDTTIYTEEAKPTSWTAYTTYSGTSAGSISDYYVTTYDSEENIWIPRRWHYILVEGLKYWMYGNMWVNFEWARGNARAFYDSEKMKALQNIVDRGQEADTPYEPDLLNLIY